MKILITGAQGRFGTYAVQKFSQNHSVIDSDKERDITKPQIVSHIIAAKPDIIIHAAAETNVDKCEIHQESAHQINVLGTINVIKAAQLTAAKLIYISSDYIFDGNKGNYIETDRPNPINYYGKTKWEAEQQIMKYTNSLIIRSAVLYGRHIHRSSFPRWVITNLKANKPIQVVTDQINSPTLIDDLVNAIPKLWNQSGVLHVAGSQQISRYEFAMKTAHAFNLPTDLIKPIESHALNQVAPRPKNAGLNTNKITSMGITMSTIEQGLQKLQ